MDACNNGLEGISSKPSTSNLRVLLVDDNDINLQVLAKALKRHMADIFEFMDMVSSGEGAIEKLKQTAYDLILMDIDMPGLNGIDAATWIRRGHHLQDQQLQLELDQYNLDHVLTQNRRAPIVAVTTNMSMEWKKAYLKVGMVRFWLPDMFEGVFRLWSSILTSRFLPFRTAVFLNQSLLSYYDIL
jgi:CheY-like chemotaxis protein